MSFSNCKDRLRKKSTSNLKDFHENYRTFDNPASHVNSTSIDLYTSLNGYKNQW
jgi:hypothetical protein